MHSGATTRDSYDMKDKRNQWYINCRYREMNFPVNIYKSMLDLNEKIEYRNKDVDFDFAKPNDAYIHLCDDYDKWKYGASQSDCPGTAPNGKFYYEYHNMNFRSDFIADLWRSENIWWDDPNECQITECCNQELIHDFLCFLEHWDCDGMLTANWMATLGSKFKGWDTYYAMFIEFNEWQAYNGYPVRHHKNEFTTDPRTAPEAKLGWGDWCLMKMEYVVQCEIEIANDKYQHSLHELASEHRFDPHVDTEVEVSSELPF